MGKKKKKKKLPTVRLNKKSTREDIINAVKKVYFCDKKPQEPDQRAAFTFLVGIVSYNLDKDTHTK